VAVRTQLVISALGEAEGLQPGDSVAGGGSGVTHGTATIDFGGAPGSNEAGVAFADAAVLAGSKVRAYFMAGDSTADHPAADHRYAPLFIHLTALPTAGVGGMIFARSEHKMHGQWVVRYTWE
jgi:hypothetical protein